MKRKIIKNILKGILICFVLLGFICYFSAKWYLDIYGDIGFDAIIFTLLSNLNGVQSDLVLKYLKEAAAPAVLCWIVVIAVLFVFPRILKLISKKNKHRHEKANNGKWLRVLRAVACIGMSCVLIFVAAKKVDLTTYISGMLDQTTLYKEYYVDPKEASITFPEQKKNLIYILMESMEMTYTAKEQGGVMEKNLIPELWELAESNINFSNTDTVGGGRSAKGSTWTIGAMVSQTAGIPLKLPVTVDANSYGEYSRFLPGATSLSDILNKNGYYQALMVGSDAAFGGRSNYFSQHGTDKIYDVYTAKDDGIIAQDYWVWWGMEDLYLYKYAKQALTDISSSSDKPFAFTMLTVDTHHVGGYRCAYCKQEYEQNYSNVISCASRQLVDFIDWIKAQDFYENTVIVISGDHPSMDSGYIQTYADESYVRRIYNCFINAKAEPVNMKNRDFVTLDMFPTVLSAMGCTIEGERLGLGTNLFSSVDTLAEELGFEVLQAELSKTASYYDNNILNNYD